MICRKWTAWTTKDNASKYARLFQSTIIPKLTAGNSGFMRSNILMIDHGVEVEITTLLWFESIEAVMKFAGTDYTSAVTPPDIVQPLLLRYDQYVEHHTVLV